MRESYRDSHYRTFILFISKFQEFGNSFDFVLCVDLPCLLGGHVHRAITYIDFASSFA